MDEEFLKKFVGKKIVVQGFGMGFEDSVQGTVESLQGEILHMKDVKGASAYIDVDGIFLVLPMED